MLLKGKVTTGFGKGYYFISQPEYTEQFIQKLYFKPCGGTLNLKLSDNEISKLTALKNSKGILIKGFERKGKTFGDVKCFFASIKGIDCAVIVPVRSTHKNAVELISKHYLRNTLNLREGDEVEVEVFL
jgi:riboflavin kinase